MFRLFGFCSVVQHGASRPGTSELPYDIRDHPARAADNRARERGSGCSGAAKGVSAVQRAWRLEKARRARLKTPQCAHMGTLEPKMGHQLRCFPPVSCHV